VQAGSTVSELPRRKSAKSYIDVLVSVNRNGDYQGGQ